MLIPTFHRYSFSLRDRVYVIVVKFAKILEKYAFPRWHLSDGFAVLVVLVGSALPAQVSHLSRCLHYSKALCQCQLFRCISVVSHLSLAGFRLSRWVDLPARALVLLPFVPKERVVEVDIVCWSVPEEYQRTWLVGSAVSWSLLLSAWLPFS